MSRQRTFRCEAIVLRRYDFGEADRMLTLYSREYGKIKGLAKGARKPQTRKTGHVELFMRTNFLLAKGKNIDIVTQAELVEAYPSLREDLFRTTYAIYSLELVDGLTAEADQDVRKYELLANTLRRFEQAEEARLVARYFELHLLSLAGYQPQLFNCLSCGEAIEEQDQYFSVELGGLLCPGCREEDRRAQPISAPAVKVLRYLQTRSWDVVRSLHLRLELHAELEKIMHMYLRHLLERNLRSVDFLQRLRQETTFLNPSKE